MTSSARGRLARAFVDDFRPDLSYASDDDAQEHVMRARALGLTVRSTQLLQSEIVNICEWETRS
ncbi:MAG: hypothetical protein RL227_40 [Pseudomonadota bacterium]|jgi:hypothetical protein